MVNNDSPDSVAKFVCEDPKEAEHRMNVYRASWENGSGDCGDLVALYQNLLAAYYSYRDGSGADDKTKTFYPLIKKYFKS